MGGMCGALPAKDSVLSFPAFGQTRHHRVGAGKLSLRRKRRRRHAEANLRSLLYTALLAQAGRDDRSQNDSHHVRRERALASSERKAGAGLTVWRDGRRFVQYLPKRRSWSLTPGTRQTNPGLIARSARTIIRAGLGSRFRSGKGCCSLGITAGIGALPRSVTM